MIWCFFSVGGEHWVVEKQVTDAGDCGGKFGRCFPGRSRVQSDQGGTRTVRNQRVTIGNSTWTARNRRVTTEESIGRGRSPGVETDRETKVSIYFWKNRFNLSFETGVKALYPTRDWNTLASASSISTLFCAVALMSIFWKHLELHLSVTPCRER